MSSTESSTSISPPVRPLPAQRTRVLRTARRGASVHRPRVHGERGLHRRATQRHIRVAADACARGAADGTSLGKPEARLPTHRGAHALVASGLAVCGDVCVCVCGEARKGGVGVCARVRRGHCVKAGVLCRACVCVCFGVFSRARLIPFRYVRPARIALGGRIQVSSPHESRSAVGSRSVRRRSSKRGTRTWGSNASRRPSRSSSAVGLDPVACGSCSFFVYTFVRAILSYLHNYSWCFRFCHPRRRGAGGRCCREKERGDGEGVRRNKN